ncbi:NADP-dependent malic enzyme [Anaerohalosphaera lusitana]|uniref:NADP-dependent malic enzyme n=2 Tax=Anaerohalosphaera lusitana TaxID=1936003 RepID=A0A1U9NM19_9BACT|nr:NADP-dependent malic enzyme [Anaerohalosphaera lusitana]
MADKPGILGKVTSVIGDVGVHVGSIDLVEVDDQTQVRDILIYCKSKDEVAKTVQGINALDDVEVVDQVDEIMEIHRRGAVEMVSRIPIQSLTDLRMVYTPGVASVCKEIQNNPESAWDWTGLCDRVAIITDGTAVLGLGDIGVVPSLPVMEGKAAIFAEFANLSAIPILVDSKDPKTVIETSLNIAPSFGAIQLEDIAAPACFEIEEALREKLDVPVFHDDQHGTATVVLAALINAIKATGKKTEDCNVIMLGAGAAGIAISKILLDFGVKDIVVYDSTGPIYKGRTERMTKYKDRLADITNKQGQTCPLAEGFKDKDIFIGVAQPNMVSKEMVASMNPDPICFPLSNPVGEISAEDAIDAGAAVYADGRGVNNALAYPGIFRGALDVHADAITLSMQIAAAKKLAEIADEDCLLPDMLDRNVHRQVADAVAADYLNSKK